MKAVKTTWAEFAARYCKTQDCTPECLADRLRGLIWKYKPTGFFMGEAQLFDSTWFGTVTVLPYGPNNTFKDVPETPYSPRGLASDTSLAILYIEAGDVPIV